MTDIAKVAAGLSEAQRRALLWLAADGSSRGGWKGSEVSFYVMKQIIKGDPKKEIATVIELCFSPGRTSPTKKMRWGDALWQATPLGLAVRAYLEGQNK